MKVAFLLPVTAVLIPHAVFSQTVRQSKQRNMQADGNSTTATKQDAAKGTNTAQNLIGNNANTNQVGNAANPPPKTAREMAEKPTRSPFHRHCLRYPFHYPLISINTYRTATQRFN